MAASSDKADKIKTLYVATRQEWRAWLEANFRTEREIWLIFPLKGTGKPSLVYNDAVEEALCFGWIDSTVRKLDDEHKIQWFLPRKNKNYYSTSNRERIRWLVEHDLVHPSLREELEKVAGEAFVFAPDILIRLQEDAGVWENYRRFSEGYRRIRIGYIESARGYPEEFEKRLLHFIAKTKAGKLIPGYGGIDKYY